MEQNSGQILILAASISGWIFSSFPTLRYIIYVSEGQFRWQLVAWFALLTASIFGMKMSLYSITGWPEPGTWTSRLFYLLFLLGAYLIPFIREYFIHWYKNISRKN